MAASGRGDLGSTALFRCASNVGFNARVEPLWHTFHRLGPQMGFWERWRERRRLRALVHAIRRGLRLRGARGDGWEDGGTECVCNLRVAKLGIVTELKEYLRGAVDAGTAKEWPHLMAVRDREGYLLPTEFDRPMALPSGPGRGRVWVASSVRAARELEAVDARLHLARTFALTRMVDYLDATERDIAIYESRFGTNDGFWPKFAYVLLRKLTEVSLAHRMPVIFA